MYSLNKTYKCFLLILKKSKLNVRQNNCSNMTLYKLLIFLWRLTDKLYELAILSFLKT